MSDNNKMKKWIFTFGSDQLKEIQHLVNPMNVILVIEAEKEREARDIVMGSFIGQVFCTSYQESHIKKFEQKYGMRQYNLKDLESMLPKENK